MILPPNSEKSSEKHVIFDCEGALSRREAYVRTRQAAYVTRKRTRNDALFFSLLQSKDYFCPFPPNIATFHDLKQFRTMDRIRTPYTYATSLSPLIIRVINGDNALSPFIIELLFVGSGPMRAHARFCTRSTV